MSIDLALSSRVASTRVGSSSPGPRQHPSAWALWPTLGATWIALAHVVSFQGLAIWVIGGSLLTALVVLPLSLAHRRLLAILAMMAMTVLVPALAENLGGNTAGPISRASLVSCAVTGAMALALGTRYPLAIVPTSLLLLAGALGLGAAERTPWLVGLWTVAAAVTVAMVGPFRQPHLRDHRRLVPFALMLASAGAVSIVALIVTAPLMPAPWTIPGSGIIAVPAEPPGSAATESAAADASADDVSSPPEATDTQETIEPPPAGAVTVEEASSLLSWLAWALLLLLLLLILVLLALIALRVRALLAWTLLRRRLSRGTPEQRAIGAWTWLRLSRARIDRPLPVSASPDVAVAWARGEGEPDVLTVAAIVTIVAFNPSGTLSPAQADAAWAAARRGGRMPSGPLRSRWRWSARGPSSPGLSAPQ
jgi:hypothetical protein